MFREGYSAAHLRADAIAGLTVAIVALPLSMAIAIASGATPAQGLYTAIVGGFLVSALGGSRFQIGGPAGAFIVLVAATAMQHGMDGLILATFLSGTMLIAAGFSGLGTFVKFIPFPVTVGFTAGIAVIILASQIKEFFGLSLAFEPSPLIAKLPVLWGVRTSLTPFAPVLAGLTILLILILKKWRPHWPGMLVAVVCATFASALLDLPVATIGSKFGGIPSSLPHPVLPDFTYEKVIAVLPAAFSFTLLGMIESLLSALVADGMSGRRHRSNCELIAQGLANIGSALFGGFCVTGTIARTATNVRSGAHGPVAGMLHSLFLLAFMLLAAPLASYIPLAALAGVLTIVAWNMAEKSAIAILVRSGWGEATVLGVTFFLTVLHDLTTAIVVGFALGAMLFIHRMSRTVAIETDAPLAGNHETDSVLPRGPHGKPPAIGSEIVVYRIRGVLFFGAAASIGAVLERISGTHKALIVDFAAVPFLDATGANVIESLARKMHRRGVRLYIAGADPAIRRTLLTHGVYPPYAIHEETIDAALEQESILAGAS